MVTAWLTLMSNKSLNPKEHQVSRKNIFRTVLWTVGNLNDRHFCYIVLCQSEKSVKLCSLFTCFL